MKSGDEDRVSPGWTEWPLGPLPGAVWRFFADDSPVCRICLRVGGKPACTTGHDSTAGGEALLTARQGKAGGMGPCRREGACSGRTYPGSGRRLPFPLRIGRCRKPARSPVGGRSGREPPACRVWRERRQRFRKRERQMPGQGRSPSEKCAFPFAGRAGLAPFVSPGGWRFPKAPESAAGWRRSGRQTLSGPLR